MKPIITEELVAALAEQLGLEVVRKKPVATVTPESKTRERAYPADVAEYWATQKKLCKTCGKTKPVLSLESPRKEDFGIREVAKQSGRFTAQGVCKKCRAKASAVYYAGLRNR